MIFSHFVNNPNSGQNKNRPRIQENTSRTRGLLRPNLGLLTKWDILR